LIAPVVVGMLARQTLLHFDFRHSAVVGLGLGTAILAPVPVAAAAFFAFAISRFRSGARGSRFADVEREACFEASELVALGLAGGLSLAAAHRAALSHSAPEARAALSLLVQSMTDRGARRALMDDVGPMAGASRVLAAAAASGAAALPALEGHLETESHRRHTARVEVARRLPVRLLLPLTLLVLPGFVLLTVGPTVVSSLARLNP
jgi:hypothetical protein